MAVGAALSSSGLCSASAIKRLDRRRTANFVGAFMRRIGPFLPEHRIGRDNLRTAFQQKSDPEIEQILAGVSDNLGRIAVEFAHLDEFCVERFGRQTTDSIGYTPETAERYEHIAAGGKRDRSALPRISPIGNCQPSSSKRSAPTLRYSIGGRISRR